MANLKIMHGLCVVANHVFQPQDIAAETLWIPLDGAIRKVTVLSVDAEARELTYRDELSKRVYSRDTYEFQQRYALIVTDSDAMLQQLAEQTGSKAKTTAPAHAEA